MNVLSQTQVEIISYSDEYREIFKAINYEWLQTYFEVTELDEKAFNNPKKEIIDKGGYIFLAQYNNTIIGSVALERITNNQYVLTRMGVSKHYQGKKVGKFLIEKAIKKSKELKLKSLILYTNQLLINALNLYFRNGFKIVPMDYVPYKRATIKMELKL